MDGCPFKSNSLRLLPFIYHFTIGEIIPIRLFMSGFEFTPTMDNINNKFSCRYYVNLVLVDEDERRYFKQQELHLWRKDLR